jgi:hypothetical protein
MDLLKGLKPDCEDNQRDSDDEETFNLADVYGKRKKKANRDEDLIISEDSCNDDSD